MPDFWVVGQNYYFHMTTGGWYYGRVVAIDEYGVTIDHSSYGFSFSPGFAEDPPIIPSPFVRFDPNLKQWWNLGKIIWSAQVLKLP